MRNASLSFSSGEPLEVTCRASMNSLHKDNLGVTMWYRVWLCASLLLWWWLLYCHLKPTVPFLLVSKVLKMFSEKVSTFPLKEEEESYSLNFLQVVIGGKQNIWSKVWKVSKDPHLGNIFEYMAINLALLSSPLGQSFRKPTYHSCRAEDDQNKVYIFL